MDDLTYLFPLFFIGLFTFVLFLLSKKGWADLASEYRFNEKFEGDRVGIISAGINGVSYNNCLLLKYNTQGLYLRPILIFRLFHKPIFIPWKAIRNVREKDMLLTKLKELVIGEPTIALIQFPRSTFSKIERMIPSRGGSYHVD